MAKKMGFEAARHLFSRAGFGADYAAIEAAAKRPAEEVVDALLTSAKGGKTTLAPPSFVGEAPARIEMRAKRREIMAETDPDKQEQIKAQMKREVVQTAIVRALELKGWWIQEMVATPAPLQEKMLLFWHNHFTSSLTKVKSPVLIYNQHMMLRKHALGSFREMLAGVARDPAMILYLDNVSNRRRKPNENFARELLELFTLGEGHYTEKDIKEAARAFTGWTLDRKTGEFRFAQGAHDPGQKTFMGKSGALGGQDILNSLLEKPQTSIYIVGKAWRAFVSEEPDNKEIERIAKIWRASDYDNAAMMRALLTSREFYRAEHQGNLIKSPVELIVGTLRLFRMQFDKTSPIVGTLRRLGQDIFEPPNVKGWPGGKTWITSDSLLMRQQILTRVFRDPGNFPDLTEDGWDALLGTRQAKNTKTRADLLRRTVVPVEPIYSIADVSDDAFELARQLALDPTYQLC